MRVVAKAASTGYHAQWLFSLCRNAVLDKTRGMIRPHRIKAHRPVRNLGNDRCSQVRHAYPIDVDRTRKYLWAFRTGSGLYLNCCMSNGPLVLDSTRSSGVSTSTLPMIFARAFDPDAVLNAIERHGCTRQLGLPLLTLTATGFRFEFGTPLRSIWTATEATGRSAALFRALRCTSLTMRRKLEVDPSGHRESSIGCGFALLVNHSKKWQKRDGRITVVIVFFAPEIMR
jgi:hypothetical protein